MKLKATFFMDGNAVDPVMEHEVPLILGALTEKLGYAPEEAIRQAIENGKSDPGGTTEYAFAPMAGPVVWINPRLVQLAINSGKADPIDHVKRFGYVVTEPVVDPAEFGLSEVDMLEDLWQRS